ncbi:flagellar hook-associated protein FlgK [Desulfocurvus vexinensis]|uniref:flagellar hook-associated protein FlgK n=1 Tax=Desulfocurvus vexinensis TaxID=399548 RepID=UPI00048F4031|nr:flagellar hook-associated protein FlgK [Desulfocurvus vexinensis]
MADSLLTIGGNTLSVAQYALSVYSNNVANASTEGYRRQTVSLADTQYLTTSGGLVGTGVSVAELQRCFDTYVERQFLAQSASAARWETASSWLTSIENVFNQSSESGLDAALTNWFSAWETVTQYPSDLAVREALNAATSTLTTVLCDMSGDLARQEELINEAIEQGVDEANALITRLGEVNKSLIASPGDNGLLNERDALVRSLAELVDVNVVYKGNGQVTVFLGSGQTLVDGASTFELRYEGPKAWSSLTAASTFDGAVYFDGSSSNEITLQVVSAGSADGGAGAATYRVSYDGGKTWLTDASGNVQLFTADDASGAVTVDGVQIWFGATGDSGAAASGALAKGDTFTVMAKSGVYWYENTSSFMNVTSVSSAGTDNTSRLTGGSLAGLLTTRDQSLGTWQSELDALAASIIWETNFAHSQGAGLTNFTSVTGTYAATDSSAVLADSGLAFAGRVQSGALSIALYDAASGEALGVTDLDFSSIVPPGVAVFDPAVHSLDDVAAAVNASFPGQLTATVTNGVLSLSAADGVEFQFAGDSSGLLAALGINTYFTGSDASNIALNPLVSDPSRVNATTVDATGDANAGGNATATAIAALADKSVTVTTSAGASRTSSLQDYFGTLVSKAGSGASTAKFNTTYYTALADALYDQQESIGGVNLDEELIRIEQFQRMYQVASTMIQTSMEMFETLIALKS